MILMDTALGLLRSLSLLLLNLFPLSRPFCSVCGLLPGIPRIQRLHNFEIFASSRGNSSSLSSSDLRLSSNLPGFRKTFACFSKAKSQTVPPSQTRQIRLQTHFSNRPKRSLGTPPKSQKPRQNAAWHGGTLVHASKPAAGGRKFGPLRSTRSLVAKSRIGQSSSLRATAPVQQLTGP